LYGFLRLDSQGGLCLALPVENEDANDVGSELEQQQQLQQQQLQQEAFLSGGSPLSSSSISSPRRSADEGSTACVVARRGVRLVDGRRIVAWLERKGLAQRTVHAYAPSGSETFVAAVSPRAWVAAATAAAATTATVPDADARPAAAAAAPAAVAAPAAAAALAAADVVVSGRTGGEATEEAEAARAEEAAARVLLGWLRLNAAGGLHVATPDELPDGLPDGIPDGLPDGALAQRSDGAELFDAASSVEPADTSSRRRQRRGELCGSSGDVLLSRCAVTLSDGRRLVVWLRREDTVSAREAPSSRDFPTVEPLFSDQQFTVQAFDPLSALTCACAVTAEAWEAARQRSKRSSTEAIASPAPAGAEATEDAEAKAAAAAAAVLFGWLCLSRDHGLRLDAPGSADGGDGALDLGEACEAAEAAAAEAMQPSSAACEDLTRDLGSSTRNSALDALRRRGWVGLEPWSSSSAFSRAASSGVQGLADGFMEDLELTPRSDRSDGLTANTTEGVDGCRAVKVQSFDGARLELRGSADLFDEGFESATESDASGISDRSADDGGGLPGRDAAKLFSARIDFGFLPTFFRLSLSLSLSLQRTPVKALQPQ
jgi:hypothetical protein